MTQERSSIPRWWPVALSEEITSQSPTPRRCGDQEFVLFRDHKGVAHALEDRCAHRRVPLSLGRITETGALQCGYHGWCFDGASGQCVAITTLDPTERVPGRYKVPAFRVRERNGFVYVWSGVPSEASDDRLPAIGRQLENALASGAAVAAISQEAIVGILLDAPGLILSFQGLAILPELLGDPQVTTEAVQTEYAIATSRPLNRTQSPSDFPFVLRIRSLSGTGQSNVSAWTLGEDCLFAAEIALEPVRPWVTALRWRYFNLLTTGDRQIATFSILTQFDPTAMVALRATPASDLWSALSRNPRHAEASPVSESRSVR